MMRSSAEESHVTSNALALDPQRPGTWLQSRGETLRELPGRRVYRAVASGVPVVVKEYRPRRFSGWLKEYAETEGARALAARMRGVDVVEPLAWARFADGRQMLLLREEAGARSLMDLVLHDPPRGAARHRLAQRVGALVATLQNEGFRHDDPHAGNLLVRPDGSVLFADARDIRGGSYLSPKERAADLARFAPFFFKHGSLVDLLLFWGEYGRVSQLAPDDLEELRRLVLDKVPAAFRRLTRSRTRRARRHGRPIRIDAFAGIVVGELAPDTLQRIVDRASRLGPGDDVLKSSRTAWTLRIDGLIVKVFLPKKATHALRDCLSGTRADRALLAAEAMRHRGLTTPRVVATLRDGTRSVLVMEEVKDAFPIEEVLRSLPPVDARRAAVRLGKTLRRMHDWGLRHRDLKQQNLLLARDGAHICFLDVDGVRQSKRLDWDRRAKDLGNLDGSLFDFVVVPTGLRLRALDAYLSGESRPGFVRDVIGIGARQRERRAAR